MHCNAAPPSVQPFTQFLNGTFLEIARQAGSTAVTVWCYLLSRTNRDGKCWPSQQTLAADLGLGIRTVQRALTSLESLGVLTREVVGRRHSYQVFGSPCKPVEPEGTRAEVTAGAKMTPESAPKRRTNNIQGNNIQEGFGFEVLDPFLRDDRTTNRSLVLKAPPGEGAKVQSDSQAAPEAVEGEAHPQPVASRQTGSQRRQGGARRGGQLPIGVTEQDLRHVDRMAQIHRASKGMPWSLPKFFAAASYALERGDSPVALLAWMLRYDKRHWCQADEEAGQRANRLFERRLGDGLYEDDERWQPLWSDAAGVAA